MSIRVTPLLHVPDVTATISWYQAIGFALVATHERGGVTDWAELELGGSRVMFTEGGRPATRDRRDVDLYVRVGEVEELYGRLKDDIEIVKGLHDTFYGMREFIARDPNGFWLTFGQPSG